MSRISEVVSHLTKVERGDSVFEVASSKRINAIQDAIMFLLEGKHITHGQGIRIARRMGAVRISGAPGSKLRGGGAYSVWNFSTTSSNGKHTITFRDGMVNNIAPDNLGEAIELKSGENFILARAKAKESYVETVTLEVASRMDEAILLTTKGAPPPTVPVMIAKVTVDGESAAAVRLRFRNVICTPTEVRREGKKITSPGEEPFDRYYAWQVSDPEG